MISKLPGGKHKTIVAFLLLVGACARQTEMQRAFLALFPGDDVNQTLVLAPLDSSGGAVSGKQATTFILSNKSGVPVVYNPANGVYGLAWDAAAQQWEKIRNKVEVKNAPWTLAAAGGELPSIDYVDFWPDVAPDRLPLTLRVVVEGQLLDALPGNAIAFYDVEVEQP